LKSSPFSQISFFELRQVLNDRIAIGIKRERNHGPDKEDDYSNYFIFRTFGEQLSHLVAASSRKGWFHEIKVLA
jgi:hypothetical protein